jgi:L-rhamnonate dehydratase
VFGNLFANKPVPSKGYLDVSELGKAEFGLELSPSAPLIPAASILCPTPKKSLKAPPAEEQEKLYVNGVAPIAQAIYSVEILVYLCF